MDTVVPVHDLLQRLGGRNWPLVLDLRGADTDRLDLTPQSPGLLAVSLGLGCTHPDDLQLLNAGLVLYDALYASCRHARGETHGWHPETMR
jgi:hypothetical protein